jgi:hypothetical protein
LKRKAAVLGQSYDTIKEIYLQRLMDGKSGFIDEVKLMTNLRGAMFPAGDYGRPPSEGRCKP